MSSNLIVNTMWATSYIEALRAGETVSFRPRGNSMRPKIESGQLVTVSPVGERELQTGDIVLCKVSGHQYLHIITAIDQDGRCQISNNRGHINGWTQRQNVFGVVVKVED